jgi:TetR/AcrR family transcriptional regulator, regulator of autoinduction and epiphytic fitness
MATSRRADPRSERSAALAWETALELFRVGGLHAVTIEAVASQAGLARTTVYRRWPTRAALMNEVLESYRIVLTVPERSLPLGERLRSVLDEMQGYLTRPHWRGALAQLVAVVSQGEAGHHGALHNHAAHEAVIQNVITDGIADRDLAPDTDVREAMFQVIGPLLAAALLDPSALRPEFPERVVALFLQSRGGFDA